jgi:membrane glycosyltransferase
MTYLRVIFITNHFFIYQYFTLRQICINEMVVFLMLIGSGKYFAAVPLWFVFVMKNMNIELLTRVVYNEDFVTFNVYSQTLKY